MKLSALALVLLSANGAPMTAAEVTTHTTAPQQQSSFLSNWATWFKSKLPEIPKISIPAVFN